MCVAVLVVATRYLGGLGVSQQQTAPKASLIRAGAGVTSASAATGHRAATPSGELPDCVNNCYTINTASTTSCIAISYRDITTYITSTDSIIGKSRPSSQPINST
jgi:hypothetical protein